MSEIKDSINAKATILVDIENVCSREDLTDMTLDQMVRDLIESEGLMSVVTDYQVNEIWED